MSEITNTSVNTATRSTSVNHLLLDNLFINEYSCNGLQSMPFDPSFDSNSTANAPTRSRPFGDIVVDVNAFADTNFESISLVPGRYLTCIPRKETTDFMRDFHVVAHQTVPAQNCVSYIIPETNAAIAEEVTKTMPPGWKNLYHAESVFTSVSLDDLYSPLLERAFMCSFSIRMNNPTTPLVISPNEWYNITTWVTHGSQMRAGAANTDPTVIAALAGTIPIHLPGNLRINTVILGLTLLAACARSHFYPIVNHGNPFSNHCVATPGRVVYLANQDIPATLPDLNQNNIGSALRQLGTVCDYLGISSDAFTAAAANALRAAWVLPDTYTIPSLVENAYLSDVNAYPSTVDQQALVKQALVSNLFRGQATAQAWLMQEIELIDSEMSNWLSLFLRCDTGALSILSHIMQNPTVADNPVGTEIPTIELYSRLPIFERQYTRPINYLGHRVTRKKYGWYTFSYLSHIQKKNVDALAVSGKKIDVSWLPKYTLKFLGGVCALLACAQSVAINQAPITRFNNVGGYNGIIHATLSGLEIDNSGLTTTANSPDSFTATLAINQMYTVGFTTVPSGGSTVTISLPANTAQRFGECLITLMDPKFVLSAIGAWTPQLPLKKAGVVRAYKTLVLPNMRNVDFLNDGIVDVRILLYRLATIHGLTPTFALLNTFDAEGEPTIVVDTPIYTAQYLGVLQALPDITSYLVPVFNFDKFAKPAQVKAISASRSIYSATDKLDIAYLKFSVGAYPRIDPPQAIPMITAKAKQQLKHMLAAITIKPVPVENNSQNQEDAKEKLGQTSIGSSIGNPTTLDPIVVKTGLSELSVGPDDSASQQGLSSLGTAVNNAKPAPTKGQGFH